MKNFIKVGLYAAILSPLAYAQDSNNNDWPSNLIIGTGSPGATYAIYGQGLASVISKHVGVPASTQQTQGPHQNVLLANNGRIDIALTTTGPAYEAWIGESEFIEGKATNLRAIAPMYTTPFQIAALADSGISSVSDLEGMTIGAGPLGGTGSYWPSWFELLGYDIDVQHGPLGDQVAQLADGRLSAVATAAGVPTAAFSELETTTDATFFSLSSDDIQQLTNDLPYAETFQLPADTYDSLDEPLDTIAMWNIIGVHVDMPDDLAYEITKSIFENNQEMVSTHSSAIETQPENIINNRFMTMHPGAVRYYDEIGVELPSEIVE